jgi:ATP-dependent protease ClpP protease subunit
MRTTDNDDEENGDIEDIKIFTTEHKCHTYDVYLGESVNESTQYYELFHMLDKAQKNDHFVIHLNNFGGALHTGLQLINCLNKCKATITMSVESHVYSMASLLALCGDIIMVHPKVVMMFHDYSGGSIGKGSEMEKNVDSDRIFWAGFLKDVCYPFLTKPEIKQLIRGEDIYVHQETTVDSKTGRTVLGINERLKKFIEHKGGKR